MCLSAQVIEARERTNDLWCNDWPADEPSADKGMMKGRSDRSESSASDDIASIVPVPVRVGTLIAHE